MPRKATDAPIYRRGDSPYWWTWIYDGSRRVRVSTKCTDRKAALIQAAKLQREAVSPRDPYAHETVADALIAYLDQPVDRAANTNKIYHQRAAALSDSMGWVRISELTRDHIEAHIKRRARGKRTVKQELETLRAALRLARARGRKTPDLDLLIVPVPGLIVPRQRWITKAEYGLLAGVLEPHWVDWMRLVVYTGARTAEANGMRWSDVDFDARILHIRGKKTDGSDRYVPIAAPLFRWMKRSRPSTDGPIVRQSVRPREWLLRACKSLSMPNVAPHDLRRTFASWLHNDGASERDIADLLGHTTTVLTRTVYAKTSMDRLRHTISRLK